MERPCSECETFSGGNQLRAGARSQVMIRRQGAECVLLMGVCSQRTILRRPTANRPGPLSVGCGRAAVSDSEGASQYGLCCVGDRFVPSVDESRSAVTPVIDNFSSAPI